MARNNTVFGSENNIQIAPTGINPYAGTDTELDDIISTASTGTGITAKMYPRGRGFDIEFTLASVVISSVDDATGSYGSVQLGDFNSNWDHLLIEASYVAFDSIASETDASIAIDWGVGTTAIAATANGDVSGTATQVNLVTNSTATTLSSNALADVIRAHDSAGETLDLAGVTDIFLNLSATGASSTATQNITVSGRVVLKVTPAIFVA